MCLRVKTYEIYQLSNIGILMLKHMSDKISICVHTGTIILHSPFPKRFATRSEDSKQ